MSNSWKWIGSKCYYFDKDGVMAADKWIGDDYVDRTAGLGSRYGRRIG